MTTVLNDSDPAWLKIAKKWVGLKEYPGSASNPTILDWAKKVGSKILGMNYTDDATPWCALFVSFIMTSVGVSPPAISVRASSWAKFGTGLSLPAPGAILVFQRPGGGHVGFYVSEDDTTYHVLGGNQGDSVSITKIAKERCVAIRWPNAAGGALMPGYTGPVKTIVHGQESKNEA